MNLLEFIVQLTATVGTVAVAWLALRGKLADIAKSSTAAHTDAAAARTDAKAARAASEKTESSINNRDSPASDRWDAIHEDIRTIVDTQKEQGRTLKEQGRDLRGLQATAQLTRRTLGQLRGEDRIARQETEQLRVDLTDHVRQTAPMMPMLHDLHTRYGQKLPD